MLNETTFHRQLDILAPNDAKKEITIIGAGAVGSITAFCLAKIGCPNIKIYDFDKVETHNVPSQMFNITHVGMPKVEALGKTIHDWTQIDVKQNAIKWDGSTSQIMILAVDSMKERKKIYEKLKTNFMVELMIEARMGAESMRVYPLMPANPEHQKFYEKTLYSDKEASPEVCTNKAIAYNTFVISGIISSIVKKHLKNEEIPKELIFNMKDYTFLKL